jgi:hypothetical protein
VLHFGNVSNHPWEFYPAHFKKRKKTLPVCLFREEEELLKSRRDITPIKVDVTRTH